MIGTASTASKRRVALAAGADHVVDYTSPDWQQQIKDLCPRGVDVVYDPVGLLVPSLKVAAWGARLLVVGFAGGVIEQVPANLVLLKGVSIVGVRGGEAGVRDPARGRRTIAACFDLVDKGLRPVLHDRVYDGLEELRLGLDDLEHRRVAGKAVVRIRRDESKAKL